MERCPDFSELDEPDTRTVPGKFLVRTGNFRQSQVWLPKRILLRAVMRIKTVMARK